MKKGNWIIALTLAAALSLAGCGAAPEEPAATATPEPTVTAVPTAEPTATAVPTAEPTSEPTEEPTAEPAAAPDTAADLAEKGRTLYAAQLNRYAAALSEQWTEGRYFENGMSELATYYYEGDACANAGIAFPDLDGDGSPELVIGAISGADTDPAVFEIWTVADGAPVMVAQSHARSRYYVEYAEEENLWYIANEGSNGAANSAWFYYTLQNGKLVLQQSVTYDAAANESAPWYMTYDEDWDVTNDTPSDEVTCRGVIDSNTSRYMALDYTPYTAIR